MKKIIAIFSLAVITVFNAAKADEGMWLLLQIKGLLYKDMKKAGLKLKPEDIYNVNESSLKDAIVSFGGFCTGEVISSKGLLLTNHHCGYGAIQSNSTPENNILKNGFWAKNHGEEIPIEGLYVSILQRMENVTTDVLKGVTEDMDLKTRMQTIEANKAAIKEAQGNKHKIEIAEMFDGNEYYMFVFNVYNDIRLVGTPPESVGKFGGDTDNWMWPRHTGDFSMFRIYADKDNNPAEYSAENVPYVPAHHLPVSMKGVEEGDYAMIMGFPGSTDRYMTSWEVNQAVNIDQPARVKIRTIKLDEMKEGMDSDVAIRIKYAAKYAQTANYWKYFQGQTKGLKRLGVEAKKAELEKNFTTWVNGDENRKKMYSTALSQIEEGVLAKEKFIIPQTYFFEAIYGAEINKLIFKTYGLYMQLGAAEVDQEKLAQSIEKVREEGKGFFKDYDYTTSKNIYASLYKLYAEDVDASFQSATMAELVKASNGDYDAFAEAVYSKSMFTDEARFNAFLDEPKAETLGNDDAVKMLMELYGMYNMASDPSAETKIAVGKRLFAKGLMEMQPEKDFYPNANSTIRLTYGNVGAYTPYDGAHYDYYTTAKGILEKEDNTNPEFEVPAKLHDLIVAKDFGRFADEDGNLRVCFISNNDITGGNSGSPVINGNGELIGTAFDGNWEAMSGDIAFETELQRTISVDIRYTLFIIEKLAGAKHIVDEMTLVK